MVISFFLFDLLFWFSRSAFSLSFGLGFYGYFFVSLGTTNAAIATAIAMSTTAAVFAS